ncbi:hypothetical protein Q9251_21735 [Alkalihalobacillus macyae]|uniref:hypothetical protein n=1 Tax=Guptibacillus hwajinpoensis TaxID=208199 RepID=UPI00273B07E7|nr:hypothetical protein [Alkalihalobacillus macyae]MDP4553478.1 hypothetical protein [Alkalihalobacillus macyae]
MNTLRILLTALCLNLLIYSGASANYTSKEFQESLFDIGYVDVQTSLKEFNTHFNSDVSLPVQIPSIPFTHSFGRFNNLKEDISDGLEIEFINKDSTKNHYMIWIKPIDKNFEIDEKTINKTYHISDGSKAIYSTRVAKTFNTLIFEKNEWQYTLNIDARVADQVTPKKLVEIANSIN